MKKRQRAFAILHSCVIQNNKPLVIGKTTHVIRQKIASKCRKKMSRGLFLVIMWLVHFKPIVKWQIEEWVTLSFCYSRLAKEKQIALTELQVNKHPCFCCLLFQVNSICFNLYCYSLLNCITLVRSHRLKMEPM